MGLQTHMLLSVGTALIMLVSAFGFADMLGQKNVVSGPVAGRGARVLGIGFLSAGSILMRGEVVRGRTTAASLWLVSGVGLAVGGGIYTASIGATVIISVIFAGMKPLERRFISVKQQRTIQLLADRDSITLNSLHEALGSGRIRVKQFIVQQSEDDPPWMKCRSNSRTTANQFEAISRRLLSIHSVRSSQPKSQ